MAVITVWTPLLWFQCKSGMEAVNKYEVKLKLLVLCRYLNTIWKHGTSLGKYLVFLSSGWISSEVDIVIRYWTWKYAYLLICSPTRNWTSIPANFQIEMIARTLQMVLCQGITTDFRVLDEQILIAIRSFKLVSEPKLFFRNEFTHF